MFRRIIRKKITSHSAEPLFISILLALALITVSTSCKIQFFPDIKNYLKENTELAAVDKCLTDLDSYSITDPNGKQVYCISSNDDFVIKLRLRNPQNYTLIPSEPKTYLRTAETDYVAGDPSITVSFDKLFNESDYLDGEASYEILTKTTSNPTYALIEIDKDSYYLTLTYSKDFLNKTEMGHNISPTIKLRHPKTKVPFETYSDLKIVCNSAPPAVYGPIVYIDESKTPNQYVLLFNMPKNDDLRGIHKDISQLTVQSTGYGKGKDFEYKYKVAIDDKGAFTLTKNSESAPETSKGIPTDENITPTGAVFTPGDNPVFIPLNQALTTNEVIYTFTLSDAWNLKSTPAEASISSKKLSEPYFTNSKDIIISGGEKIAQDNNSSFATFNLIPALITYWFEDSTTNLIQNKYYVDEDGKTVAKNFIFDETKISKDDSTQTIIGKLNLPSDAYLKENGNKVSIQEKLNSNPWITKNANTSKCTIEYSVSQIQDDGTTTPIFSGAFDCEESSGSSPQKDSNSKLITSGNSESTLKKAGHFTSVELPGGKLLVTVYAHKTGYADSNPIDYTLEVLRTRVFVSDKIDSNDETNNGSSNSHFKTITHAAEKLSAPADTANTIYIDTDLTENIEIPSAAYVKIISTEGTRTITAGTATDSEGNALPLLTIPDNSTVILENLSLKDGDIEVGEHAKLYLNNVSFSGKSAATIPNRIHVASTGLVILGGTTSIDSMEKDENGEDRIKTLISLEEGGKVQLAKTNSEKIRSPSKTYIPQGLVIIQTVKPNPKLNSILLETEDGIIIKQAYPAVYSDLTNEDPEQAYKLFKLDDSRSPGYYIGYDDEKPGSDTFGRGLVKIPATYLIEPEVGGFTVQLFQTQYSNGRYTGSKAITATEESSYGNNVYVITKGTKLTYSVLRNSIDLVENNSVSDLKLELYIEGDLIEESKSNVQLPAPELTIPGTYPSGYYTIYAYFTFDDITYCEHFIVYLKEAE